MSVEGLLGLWAESMPVSVAIWLGLLVVVLYAGRRWIEPFVLALFQGLDRLLRFSGRSVRAVARHVDRRHRDYLRSMARQHLDHRLHRELRGLHDRVTRDLGGYPVIQRAMHEQIQRLERDYHAAEDALPAEPPWLHTVAKLAGNPPKGDPAVTRVLESIHDGLQQASRAAMDQYEATSRKRLDLLRDMLPAWWELAERLRGVEHAIQGVTARSRQVDELLARRQTLDEGGPRVDVGLTVGAVGRTVVSGALLVLMVLAATVSFYLIERPMAEAFGATDRIGPWALSHLAAVLLILMAVAAGLLMSETRRLTGLLPALGTLDLRPRRRLFWGGLLVLLVVAGLHGAMAFTRDLFSARDQLLALIVAGEADLLGSMLQWIPMLTKTVIALFLPLFLALAAVPFEAFLRHGRVVVGALLALILHLLGFALGFATRLVRWVAALVSRVYALLIFVPVRLEAQIRQRANGREPLTKLEGET